MLEMMCKEAFEIKYAEVIEVKREEVFEMKLTSSEMNYKDTYFRRKGSRTITNKRKVLQEEEKCIE